MRRVFCVLILGMLGLLGAACGVLLSSPQPTPAPTATPFRPANLLTPRPTFAPTATPAPADRAQTATERQRGDTAPSTGDEPKEGVGQSDVPEQIEAIVPRPPATPTPVLRGTPVTVTEPLQGFLLDDRLDSPIIGESFAYRVYLPPDYLRSPARRYPVMYMLHGNGGNYTEWSDSFLPEQIDRLIAADDIPPFIVVMPDDGESTYYANWSDDGPRWGDYIAHDVVTFIDQHYRTLTRTESRGIAGLSMGGLGALNLAFQHPDIFGVVGSHSPSVRLEPDPMLWFLKGDDFWLNNPVWLAHNASGLEALKIYLDDGTEDVWLPNIEAVHDALVAEGIPFEWHIFPGPHEAEYWIEHVPDYLRFYAGALRT